MLAAPFPYFGGKRRAAHVVWGFLGDPGGYVEPFAGSAAVLLARPGAGVDGWRRVETLNDADGWLVNVWRSLQLSPSETAAHAFGPVSEIDYHARLAWLQERRGDDLVSWLEGHPENHDPKIAAWWLTVVAAGIGDPWGAGPWRVVDGRLANIRKLPHLGDAGRGVNRGLPHLGDAGRGVNRELPHLGNAGQGVNRELPHLGNAGYDLRLEQYFHALSARLGRVRITCGSWERVVKPSVVRAKTGGDKSRALLLDPPYSAGWNFYAESSSSISEDVRRWCVDADPSLRIVLCGYDDEHDELLGYGWRKAQGVSGGGAGYSTRSDNGRRERLWVSPACLAVEDEQYDTLFEQAGA